LCPRTRNPGVGVRPLSRSSSVSALELARLALHLPALTLILSLVLAPELSLILPLQLAILLPLLLAHPYALALT
jgi:hypothetical protein